MTKWEYKIFKTRPGAPESAIQDDLNRLGSEGWEVLHVKWDGGYPPGFVLKRQIPGGPVQVEGPLVG